MSVIDLGCGKLRNILYMKEVGFKNLVGVDVNKYQRTETELSKINFIQQDLLKGVPAPTNYFDIILCNYLLMFIENNYKSDFIKEVNRIAKPKAYFICELNPKKLAHGYEYSMEDIMQSFINLNWEIVNTRKNKFIARKRELNG